ncbi:MAG: 6-carboxytetrahydropterin synthase [Chloroflexi bacterium]|nr:6-carboxytetrahydropterin synthase [Chloroflexota bacterium]
MVHFSRRYWFAASHKLYAEEMTLEENRRVFGKCANTHGHGHNYQVWVTVVGPIDRETGMCVDMVALDGLVFDRVVSRYDHRYLNLDVEDYVDLVPTGENIARRVWEALEGRIPSGATLERVRVIETRDNAFEYVGVSAVHDSTGSPRTAGQGRRE